MYWFSPELGPLLAVAAATLDESGALIQANDGFLRVAALGGRPRAGDSVARCFVQPDFPTLAHSAPAANGDIHIGLMTIGDPMGRTQTLRARVWREDGKISVLAEYDVEELGRLNDTVLELNREYADAQLALAQMNLRLRQREAEITAISLTDPLTGIGNRRHFDQAMTRELSRATRTGEYLSVLIADIDHFKRVNDVRGHDVGDQVLVAVAGLLRDHSRSSDVVARIGGEEFVVLMPRTDLDKAALFAERLRGALAEAPIESLGRPITVSIGVAQWASGEPAEALLRHADHALYNAKKAGRNRIATG